jgi:hypothetical protein
MKIVISPAKSLNFETITHFKIYWACFSKRIKTDSKVLKQSLQKTYLN